MKDRDRLQHCLERGSKRINGDRGGGREEERAERERETERETERERERSNLVISKEAVGNSWDILCTTLGRKSYRQVL